MKTKLIEWLNERVKECGGKIQAFPSVKIAINGQSEAYRNTLAKISELDYLESWPKGKGRFEDLTEAESEIVLQKLKAISSLATTDLDEEQKKHLTEIFLKFGNGETGISTETLTEAAQKGCEETPTKRRSKNGVLIKTSKTDNTITWNSDDLPLSYRVWSAIRRSGVVSMDEPVANITIENLVGICQTRGIGKKTMNEIFDCLEAVGITYEGKYPLNPF